MSWENILKTPRPKPRLDLEDNKLLDRLFNLEKDYDKWVYEQLRELDNNLKQWIFAEDDGEILSEAELEKFEKETWSVREVFAKSLLNLNKNIKEIKDDAISGFSRSINTIYDPYHSSTEYDAQLDDEAERASLEEYERRQGFY